jgi:hypothetical protein
MAEPTTGALEMHTKALNRAGNVFLWAINEGPRHPDATVEMAAEQITAMYLRELKAQGVGGAELILDHYFPEARR